MVQATRRGRYRDQSFDYAQADTSWGVHGIHPYPAMMIYPVARRLLLEHSDEGDMVFDPFMGSGTVLVESLLHNRYAYGIDINPLAVLLARAKTTPLKTASLLEALRELLYGPQKGDYAAPNFFNIDYWFKKEVIEALSLLLRRIEALDDPAVRTFFEVSFSQTVRHCSNTRNGEFKLVRIKNLDEHKPDVLGIFGRIASRNIERLSETYKKAITTWVRILEGDTRAPAKEIAPGSVGLILTSPPYGDSKTTVAYGQFSRLSLQWLGYSKVNIDRESLGGVLSPSLRNDLPSASLTRVLKRIAFSDAKRAREVLSFFRDLNKSLQNLAPLLRHRGHLAIVVGNRRVKGFTIPTDVIIAELCREIGLFHLRTVIRAIPTKRMPRVNSPTNAPGVTDTTMNNEYIVILRKNSRHAFRSPLHDMTSL